MSAKVSYDREFDNLHIYKEGEPSKQSVEMFDTFVVDLDSDGSKVVGLEIMNASKVLKVSKAELSSVREARLETVAKDYYFGVNYVIVLPSKNRIESQLMIPQPIKSEA